MAAFNPQIAAWSHSPFAAEVERHLVRAFGRRMGYEAAELEQREVGDMILMPDFVEAARRSCLQRDRFVLLSQRWDLDVTEPIDFSEGWQNRQSSIENRQ